MGDRFYQAQRGLFRRSRTQQSGASRAGSTRGFQLTGFKELQKTLEELPKEIAGPIIRLAFRRGANVVRDEAQRRAPKSRAASFDFNRAAKVKKRASEKKSLAEAVKVVTPSRKARSRSLLVFIVRCLHPLAHIFEYGTQERVQKTTGRRTGKITAHPFMRPALDIGGPKAIDVIKESVISLLDRAAKRIARKNRSAK